MDMLVPLAIAAGFILIGVVLLHSARQSLRSGEAETEDNGIRYRDTQPIRFWLFVITQIVFGGGAVVSGALLATMLFLTRPQ